MRTSRFISVVNAALCTVFCIGQADWNTAGNALGGGEYLGGSASSTFDLQILQKADFRLFMGTSDILRFRMNQSLANGTFNSFTGQNFGGFVAMSKDGSGIATPGAFTQLHLYSGNNKS